MGFASTNLPRCLVTAVDGCQYCGLNERKEEKNYLVQTPHLMKSSDASAMLQASSGPVPGEAQKMTFQLTH